MKLTWKQVLLTLVAVVVVGTVLDLAFGGVSWWAEFLIALGALLAVGALLDARRGNGKRRSDEA